MNEGRLIRALVTLMTLAMGMWVLDSIYAPRAPQLSARTLDAPVTVSDIVETAANIEPVEIQSLPLVAMDNTCLDGITADLSSCTGMLSGGPSREYYLNVERGRALRVVLEPRSAYLDVSFAVFDDAGRCLVGRDANGAGILEMGTVEDGTEGRVRIVVSGYGEDCGPYLLTVRDTPPPLADVRCARAISGPNGRVIRWETYGEIDVSHFELIRISPQGREVFAAIRRHGSPADIAAYRIVDRAPTDSATYSLEAVARDGRREVFAIAS